MKVKNQNGDVLTIALIFIAIALVIFTFIIAVFMSHINNILYNLKLDMYSMNRSAIIAVNKYSTSMDKFSYNVGAYKDEFIKFLKSNYELDENLSNDKKLITSVEIEEYTIYEKGNRDLYTNKMCDTRTIHIVLSVKIRPIILKNYLEDIFVFTVHEDVALSSMKTER